MNNSHLDIRVPDEIAAQIREMAAARGLSVSALLRMIILQYLEGNRAIESAPIGVSGQVFDTRQMKWVFPNG